MSTPNVNSSSITIPANSVNTINASGSFIIFLANTGPFQFSFDGMSWQDGLSILSIDLYREQVVASPLVVPVSLFKKVLLRDTSGSVNTVRYVISNSPVAFVNPNATYFQKNAPTYNKSSGLIALGDGGATGLYTGTDAGGQARKTFIVCNASANIVYITDGAGRVGDVVPANQTHAFESGGGFYVQNVAGSGASNVYVTEIFYV